MPSIEVALTPALINKEELNGKITVVVDILRATSCIVTGLAHGIKEIRPIKDEGECRKLKHEGYYIAGERGGIKLQGFDMGNSPFEYMNDELKGKKVAVTTTNGTYAIHESMGSNEIIIGAFLNLSSICDYLKKLNIPVLIVCAGWRNNVNLEDTLFAGALIHSLQGFFEYHGDSAALALSAYQSSRRNLTDIIKKSDHAKRLGEEYVKDLEFCTTIDKYNIIPKFTNGSLLVT